MKQIILSCFALFLLLGSLSGVSAQSYIPEEVIEAFGKGNATVISSYLNDNVELFVDNKNDIYSKQQASNYC